MQFGEKAAGPTPTSPLLEQTTTSTVPTTPVVARIIEPEAGAVQGSGGQGMVVVLAFTAKDPAALPADFRLGGSLPAPAAAVKPGRNPAFPGLVVALSTTGTALGGPSANLANLFQIVSPSKQPDGSVQVFAVWTNSQAGFGTDTDVTLGAFTVSGNAPDVVPQNPADVSATSNPVQVTFHLGAVDNSVTASGSSTTTTAAKATSTTAKAGTTSSTTTTRPAGATSTTTRPATTTTVPATTTTTKFLGLF